MTNSNDSFIDEVTEEVRRDRLYGYFRRYGWIALVAVVAIVGGAAYTEWRRASDAAAAQAVGDSIYAAIEPAEASARAEALAALDIAGPASAPVHMLEAASLLDAGETEKAAEVLAALSADPGHPRVWRDLAALKRVLILGDALAPDDRMAALQPLSVPGAPFRVLAAEQQALAMIAKGDASGALAALEQLVADQEATPGLRLRAAQLMVTLGESSG